MEFLSAVVEADSVDVDIHFEYDENPVHLVVEGSGVARFSALLEITELAGLLKGRDWTDAGTTFWLNRGEMSEIGIVVADLDAAESITKTMQDALSEAVLEAVGEGLE